MRQEYGFIIDTDQYSGNFEREMCAYLTGCVGGCDVGKEYVNLRPEPMDFDDLLRWEPDDNGCFRPCEIWETPGFWNDGNGKHYKTGEGPEKKIKHPAYQSVIIYFQDRPTLAAIHYLKERAYEFSDVRRKKNSAFSYKTEKIKILGFRLYIKTIREETEEL